MPSLEKIEKILNENEKRYKKLFAVYDPVAGKGGLIKRRKLSLSDFGDFWIPNIFFEGDIGGMLDVAGSIGRFKEMVGLPSIDAAFSLYLEERAKWDFEFWCATSVKIKPKEGGDFINFILNPPQRKLHAITFADIITNTPIRQILTKSRQYGGSTDIQLEMLWIQVLHKTNWNSLIAAHTNQAASNIRRMVHNAQKKYGTDLPPFSLSPFEGMSNIKIIPERSNKITIGSVQTPDSIRSDDVAMAHLSEVGLWRKTEGKEPADLCQSILGTIPRLPLTRYTLESTAKGVGNFFHKTWQAANKDRDNPDWNGLTPIFVSWIEDPRNIEEFASKNEMAQFARTLSEYEELLWDRGATLQGIKFYRSKLREFNNDTWRMNSEFPTTADEAFSSSGARVFPQKHILKLRETCKNPIWQGNITADASTGKKAFDNINLEEEYNGYIKIWKMPESFVEIDDKKYKVKNRYLGFADFGGTSEKADNSCMKIFDRLDMAWGGLPEVVALWHGHLDTDLFAIQAAQLLWLYDKGLFIPESNTPESDADTEGDHFLTAITQLVGVYPNLYVRNQHDSLSQGFVPQYGFHTNRSTKPMIIDRLKRAIREPEYIERDQKSCDEMDYFEQKPNGSMGAVDGEKDDLVIVTAGGVWACFDYPFLPPVTLVEYKGEGSTRVKKKIVSEGLI